MILFRIRLRKVVVHPVAVQVPPSLAEVFVPELYPGLGGIHVAEIAEALFVEIGKFGVVHGVGMPVAHIGAERLENNIRIADQGLQIIIPFVGIRLYGV